MMRLLLFFLCLFGAAHLQSNEGFQTALLTEDARPAQGLQQLLEFLGIEHRGDLQSIVSITQKKWVQIGKERWEYQPLEEEQKTFLLPYFKNLGMIDAADATQKEYEYALVHGGFYTSVQKRIAHLVSQFNREVRFKQVVLLTGQRLLDAKTSEKDLPFQTEAEMMLSVWENFSMPEEMRKIPCLLVNAPGKSKGDGMWTRPNTSDTLIAWLKMNPGPGRCLFISSQPFCGYQDSLARMIIPSSFAIETIGPQASQGVSVAVYLDNLGRWLYTEANRRGIAIGTSP